MVRHNSPLFSVRLAIFAAHACPELKYEGERHGIENLG